MSNNDPLSLITSRNFPSQEAFVKAMFSQADHPDTLLRDMIAKGPGVLNYLLATQPQGRVLEFGAGPHSIIHHLSGNPDLACLADISPEPLLFSRQFHKLLDTRAQISYVQCENTETLPFPDDSFDRVLVNLQYSDPNKSFGLLGELRRVLRQSGQLLLIAKNRLGWEELNTQTLLHSEHFSAYGYHRLLKKADFTPSRFHALVYHDSDLRKVIRFTGKRDGASEIAALPAGDIKSRLKQGLLSTSYAIISGTGSGPSLLEEIEKDASEHLRKILGPGTLLFEDHEITRKDKVVLFARWDDRRLIMKLPLTALAGSTESNNVTVLERLQHTSSFGDRIPKTLVDGKVNDSRYFVESMLPGKPLSEHVTAHGRGYFLPQVFELLEKMGDVTMESQKQAIKLAGDTYERFVQQPIDAIARLTDDAALGQRLDRYFRPRLADVDVRTGLTHGDFSVSNLLYNQGKPLSVIDWETADIDGIPVLDAINFLDSMQRLSVKAARINQTIPQLASRKWPEANELAFLDRCYELHGIKPALHEPLVYLRWLRHMGFLIQFWLRFDKRAQKMFIYDIADILHRSR